MALGQENFKQKVRANEREKKMQGEYVPRTRPCDEACKVVIEKHTGLKITEAELIEIREGIEIVRKAKRSDYTVAEAYASNNYPLLAKDGI